MAICNRFNALQNPTGNFLSFSQYTEDLTKSFVYKNTHKVVPSKFVALDATYDDHNSVSLAQFFEEHFENGVAKAKGLANYTPEMSKSIFWSSIKDMIDGSIRWIGDINIHSSNTHDGMNYSEIYCSIPSDAKSRNYSIELSGSADILTADAGDALEGYDEIMSEAVSYRYLADVELTPGTVREGSFNINTIIVLYDVINDITNEIVHSEIPMGIYFTGTVSNGVVNNPFVKHVANAEIYGGGTSYSLKICSRYVNSSNESVIYIDNGDREGSELSLALAGVSETLNKMDEVLNKTLSRAQNYKDLYALFKNSKTNVPYIKNVNGRDYWFVNGKMLGASEMIDSECDCYTLNAHIDDHLQQFGSGTFQPILSWSITSENGANVNNIGVVLDGVTYYSSPIQLPAVDRGSIQTVEYPMTASIAGNTIGATPYVKVVNPSYVGLTTSPGSLNDDDSILLESREFVHKYSNGDLGKHIYFAYPTNFGALTSIRDSRDIEYINDFNHSVSNGYHIYWDKEPAKVTNYTLKFR